MSELVTTGLELILVSHSFLWSSKYDGDLSCTLLSIYTLFLVIHIILKT